MLLYCFKYWKYFRQVSVNKQTKTEQQTLKIKWITYETWPTHFLVSGQKLALCSYPNETHKTNEGNLRNRTSRKNWTHNTRIHLPYKETETTQKLLHNFLWVFHTHTRTNVQTYKGEEKNNMKSKTKSSFYCVSLISVEDKKKKVTKLGVYKPYTYMVRHTYRPVDGTSYICEVRLGRGRACLRLFIATLFGSYKYYFRPSCFGSCDR